MPRRQLNGRRVHFVLPKPQDRALKALAAKSDLSVSEHLRRAIDQYLEAFAPRG